MKALILIPCLCASLQLFSAQVSPKVKQISEAPTAQYVAKDYSHLYGMKGFSDALLKMHFQLYENYVKATNLYLNRIKELEAQNKMTLVDYGALRHRFGWEWDGMRLHEYYFDNLGGSTSLPPDDLLFEQINEQFGSFDNWKKIFIATGMMRGIGWVILYQDTKTGKLMNTWIEEHDTGHLAGGNPILVMDVFEHAYITEYGLDKRAYINAFFANINWNVVSARYKPINQSR